MMQPVFSSRLLTRLFLFLLSVVLLSLWTGGFVSCGPGGITGSEEPIAESASDGGGRETSILDKLPTTEQTPELAVERVGESTPDAGPVDVLPDVTLVEQPPEVTLPEEVLPENTPDALPSIVLTWAQCRRRKATLTPEEKAFCDKTHKRPSQAARYGIRWVFLYDMKNEAPWVKQRLDLLNARFQRAKMSFQTHSITKLKSTVLSTNGEYDNRKRFKLRQLKNELIELLGLPQSTTEVGALDAFKQRLLGVGVDAARVGALGLDSTFAPNAFLAMVARSMEQEVFVYVAQKLITNTGATPGGYASQPGFNLATLTRPSIYLKENYRADAMAHEVGHYFGLKHTQATQETFQLSGTIPAACKSFLPQGAASQKSVIAQHFGTDYKKPLGTPFVAYDDNDQTLRSFRELRCAVGHLWVGRANTFQKPNVQDPKTWKDFADFGAFAVHVLAGKAAYEKLFSKVTNGRTSFNCSLGQNSKKIECLYGTQRFLGSDVLLLGSIAFGQGEVSNLMSYLNNATAFPSRVLATAQDDMLQLFSRTGDRLALRNYVAGQ